MSMNQSVHPLEAYCVQQLEHFSNESKRLGTTAPMTDWKTLFDAFTEVNQSLGTLRHEVALDTLKKQFAKARQETASSFGRAWSDFTETRKRAAEMRKKERDSKAEARSLLKDLESKVRNSPVGDQAYDEAMQSTLDMIRKASKTDFSVSPLYKKWSWIGLWMDAKILAIYLLYLFHRGRVLFLFHCFILLVPILVFGIIYSLVSKSLVDLLAQLGTSAGWLFGATFLSYIFKKYYMDKKLKALQKKVETKLLKPLNVRLFIVRTLALQLDISRRG
jgi:hypothetical protein